MNWLDGWRRYYREHAERVELKEAYDNLVDAHRKALQQVDVLDAQVSELEQRWSEADAEVIDLTRANEALTSGLRWFEGSGK